MSEIAEPKRHSLLVNLVTRLVKEKPLGTVGGVIVLAMFFTGIFADFIAPYGYNDIDTSVKLSGPTAEYLLGTDQLGRDLLSRVIYGARISMIVGLGGAAIGTIIAAVLGGLSGYLGICFQVALGVVSFDTIYGVFRGYSLRLFHRGHYRMETQTLSFCGQGFEGKAEST